MKTTTTLKKITELEGNIRIIQGAGGSGKTYAILMILIIIALKRSEIPLLISICSQSFPHLRRGAMKDFFEILMSEGIYNVKNHDKTNHKYTIGRVVIEFVNVDDPDKFRGPRRDILFLNEANQVPHAAFVQLNMRTNGFCLSLIHI